MATPPNTAWQTLIGAGYGPEVVTQLRALGPQQLQELVTQGSSSSSAGVVAVQAAWLLCTRHPPGSCPDSTGLVDLTTSPSHAVGVRALTALLKCDSARLVQVVPQTSSALRTVAFQALARLGHGSLRGLVTPELLASCERHIAAKLLLKGSTEDQAALAKAQWPGLASSASFKAAFSLAARMPLLVLQLLSSTIPKHWQKQQVAQVVSVAVASSPDAAMTILGELADLPKAFFSKGFAICLLKGLAKKQPAETLQEFRRWLPADVKVRLGDATPWGELLTSCAQRAARRGQNLWHVAIELATELARLDSLAAPALFNALKLPKGMALSHEQLRSLFGITDLGHLGPLLCPLRRSTAEATLDAALCQKLSETKDVSSARGEVHSLAQWTPQARKRLAKRLATPKPEEVAGAPPSEDYLEILSWLPEEVEEVKSLCNSSNGQAREAGFKALIRNAARETPRTSEAIEEALHFFERRLKNEQDNIRAEVLQHMQDVVPLRSWSPSHVEPLRRLLMFSMQAKGSSALSLQVWANVLEVLLAHGVAMASTNEMNACGALGLEILEQLQGAAVCSKEILANMHFGTKVFERNALGDIPTTRVAAPPGGKSSISLGWDPAPAPARGKGASRGSPSPDGPGAPGFGGGRPDGPGPSPAQVPCAGRARPPDEVYGVRPRESSNSYASGNSQNTGNVLTGVSTTRVLRPPGGHSEMSLAWDTSSASQCPQAPQRRGVGASGGKGDAFGQRLRVSSNSYANGADQNCGNVLSDTPTTRVLKPPGGGSSLNLGWS